MYIETSIINTLGGLESTKEKLYNFAKTEAKNKLKDRKNL